MAANKKLTVTIEIQAHQTPQLFKFENQCSGIDQLAMWTMLKNLAEKQIDKLLGATVDPSSN